METIYKEVDFKQYCKSCKDSEVKEVDEPCNECLSEPMNVYTSKPIKWKE